MEKGPKLSQIQTFLVQKNIATEQSLDIATIKCFQENQINDPISQQNSYYHINSDQDNKLNKEQIYNILSIQAPKRVYDQINQEICNSQLLQLGTDCFVENVQKSQSNSRALSVESFQIVPSANSFYLNNNQRQTDQFNLNQQHHLNEQIFSNNKSQILLNLNQVQIPQEAEQQINQQILQQPIDISHVKPILNNNSNNTIYIQSNSQYRTLQYQNPQYQNNQNQKQQYQNHKYINDQQNQKNMVQSNIVPQMDKNQQIQLLMHSNLNRMKDNQPNQEINQHNIQFMQQQLPNQENQIPLIYQEIHPIANNFYSPSRQLQMINQIQHSPNQVQKNEQISQNSPFQVYNTQLSYENTMNKIYSNQNQIQNIQTQILNIQNQIQNIPSQTQYSPNLYQKHQNQIQNTYNQIQNSPNNQIQTIGNNIQYTQNQQQNTLNLPQNNNQNEQFQEQHFQKASNNKMAERHYTITFGSSNHLNTVQSVNNNSSTLQLLQPFQISNQNDNSKGSSIIEATADECKTISASQPYVQGLTVDLNTVISNNNELSSYPQLVAPPPQNIPQTEITQNYSQPIIPQLTWQLNQNSKLNQYFPISLQRQGSQSFFVSTKDNSTALTSPIDFYYRQNQKQTPNSQQAGESNYTTMRICDLSSNINQILGHSDNNSTRLESNIEIFQNQNNEQKKQISENYVNQQELSSSIKFNTQTCNQELNISQLTQSIQPENVICYNELIQHREENLPLSQNKQFESNQNIKQSEIQSINNNLSRSKEINQNKQQLCHYNKTLQNNLIKSKEKQQKEYQQCKNSLDNQTKSSENNSKILESSQNKQQQSNFQVNSNQNQFYYKSNPKNMQQSTKIKSRKANQSQDMAANYYERIRQFNETTSKEEKFEMCLSHHKQCFPNSRTNSLSKIEKSFDLSNMIDSNYNSTKNSQNQLNNSQNVRTKIINQSNYENQQTQQDEEKVVRSKYNHHNDILQQQTMKQKKISENQDTKQYENRQLSNEKKLQLLLSPPTKIQNLKQISNTSSNANKNSIYSLINISNNTPQNEINNNSDYLKKQINNNNQKQSPQNQQQIKITDEEQQPQQKTTKSEIQNNQIPGQQIKDPYYVAEKYLNMNDFSNYQGQQYYHIENQLKYQHDNEDQYLQQSSTKHRINNLDITITATNTKKNRYQSNQLPSQPSDRFNDLDPTSSLGSIKPEQFNSQNQCNNIDIFANQQIQTNQINIINPQLSQSQQLHKKQPKQVNTVYIDMSQITNYSSQNSNIKGQSQTSTNTSLQNQQNHNQKQYFKDNSQIEEYNSKDNNQKSNNQTQQFKNYLQNQYDNKQNIEQLKQQPHELNSQQTPQNGRKRIIQQNIQSSIVSASKQIISSPQEVHSTYENKIINFDTQFQTQEDLKSAQNQKNLSTLQGINMVTLESQPIHENINVQRFVITQQTLQTEPINLCNSNNQTPQKNIDEIIDDNDQSKNDIEIEFTPDNSLYYVQESPKIIGKQIRPTIVPTLNLQKNAQCTQNTLYQNTSFDISQSPSYYSNQQQTLKNQMPQLIPSNKQSAISNNNQFDIQNLDQQGNLSQKTQNNQLNVSNNYQSVITSNLQSGKTSNTQSRMSNNHQQDVMNKCQQTLQMNTQQDTFKKCQTTNQNQNYQNVQSNQQINMQIANQQDTQKDKREVSNAMQLAYLQNLVNQQASIPDFKRRSSLSNLHSYKPNTAYQIKRNLNQQNCAQTNLINNKNYDISNYNAQNINNSTALQQGNVLQKRYTLDQSQITNQQNNSRIIRNKSLGSISYKSEEMGIEMFMTKKQRQELDNHLMQLENRIKHLQNEEESILKKAQQTKNKAESLKKVQQQAQESRYLNQTINDEQRKYQQEQRGRIQQEKKEQQQKLKNSMIKNLLEKQEITKSEKFKSHVNKCLAENNKQTYKSRSSEQKNQIKQNQQKFQEQRNLLQLYNQTNQMQQFLLKIKEEKNKKEDIEQKIRDLQALEAQLVQRLQSTFESNKSMLNNSNIQISMQQSQIDQQHKKELLLTTTENVNTNTSFTVFNQY